MGFKEDIKHRPLVSQKWDEVRDIMSYHLAGTPPRRIFETRRPLESTNNYALEYRLTNFQPITKMPFKTAVDSIIETASHIFIKEENVEDRTKDYLLNLEIKVAGKTYDLKEYIINFVAKQVEADPNAVLVELPIHPTEMLIPDYRVELPNFKNIQNQFVDIDIELISSSRIYKLTEDELWYDAGDWVYSELEGVKQIKPYYFLLTKESTKIAIPKKVADGHTYEVLDYYFNDLPIVPFDVIGNNQVIEEIGKETISYHESTYAGAVAIGNEVLGVKSDSQIVDTRFTYPEKYMQMERCGHPGCKEMKDSSSPFAGLFINYNSDGTCSTCSTCRGTGKVAPDTSPLGTHWISKSDLFDEDNKFVPPTVYITPPLESPEYLDKKWRLDFDDMQKALFLMDQNMTNQSGDSKGFDLKQKVTVITNAVKNVFSIYERSLNVIQGFLRGEADIVVVLPPDFNIKTSQEITEELSAASNTSSLYTAELTTELLLKKFGNNQENRDMILFLELNDKLYGMTIDEIVKMKAIYGPALTIRDQVIHDKGLAILRRLSQREGFDMLSEEQLQLLFDAEIDKIVPIVNPSPIA